MVWSCCEFRMCM